MTFPLQSLPIPHVLDLIEKDRQNISDGLIELERYRSALLLTPGSDATLAQLDLKIREFSRQLDKLGGIELVLGSGIEGMDDQERNRTMIHVGGGEPPC